MDAAVSRLEVIRREAVQMPRNPDALLTPRYQSPFFEKMRLENSGIGNDISPKVLELASRLRVDGCAPLRGAVPVDLIRDDLATCFSAALGNSPDISAEVASRSCTLPVDDGFTYVDQPWIPQLAALLGTDTIDDNLARLFGRPPQVAALGFSEAIQDRHFCSASTHFGSLPDGFVASALVAIGREPLALEIHPESDHRFRLDLNRLGLWAEDAVREPGNALCLWRQAVEAALAAAGATPRHVNLEVGDVLLIESGSIYRACSNSLPEAHAAVLHFQFGGSIPVVPLLSDSVTAEYRLRSALGAGSRQELRFGTSECKTVPAEHGNVRIGLSEAAETPAPMPHQTLARQQRPTPMESEPWFESPFFEERIASRGLAEGDEQRIRAFRRDGFLILDDALDEVLIDSAARGVERIFDPANKDHGALDNDEIRVHDAWTEIDAVRSIATAESVLHVLRILYDREPVPFQTLNFFSGSQQSAHADDIHFSSHPAGFMAGVWVALEDVDEENGPLVYYPGSQRVSRVDMLDLSRTVTGDFDPNYITYEIYIDALMRELGIAPRVLTAKKGQALIWSSCLAHGGRAMGDQERSRLSQVTHYYFEDCIYYTPMYSTNPKFGEYFLREATNIRTRQVVQQSYNGWPLRAASIGLGCSRLHRS